MLRGHADLLHCVAARPGANQVVTGSEDGTVRIFDVRSEKATSVIDPWRAEEARSRGGGAAGGGSWVGCVALDEAENWLGMGCGGRVRNDVGFAAGACVSRFTASAPLQSLRLRGDNVVAAGRNRRCIAGTSPDDSCRDSRARPSRCSRWTCGARR